MKKILFFAIAWFFIFAANAQPFFLLSRSSDPQYRINSYIFHDDLTFFFEPYAIASDDTESLKPSSLARHSMSYLSYFNRNRTNLISKNKWVQKITDHELIQFVDTDYCIQVYPLVDFSAGQSSLKDNRLSQNTRGFWLSGATRKFGFTTTFAENQSYLPSFLDSFRTVSGTLPGQGPVKNFKVGGYDYAYATGELAYKAAHNVRLAFGNERQFIGDGYRSLILSDFCSPYPYFKAEWKMGPIQYRYQIAQMQDRTVPSNVKPLPTKYHAFHYLDWKVTPKWKIGVYDAIVWARVSPFNGTIRGIDWNYLNPFVFFRPLEYNNRSVDNAFLALNTSYNITSRVQTYGQLFLDEFKLSDWRKKNQSWTQKFGIQAGVKGFVNFKNNRNLFGLLEYNVVRPFTYSHQYPVQNYSHANAPLAHPLGANFHELLGQLQLTQNRFQTNLWFSNSVRGNDTSSASLGGNIFKNYNLRAADEGNFLTQGNAQNITHLRFSMAYIVNQGNNLRVELTYGSRTAQSPTQAPVTENYWSFGIKTAIFYRPSDF
jgi:hypothetical protein